MFDISRFAQAAQAPASERNIEAITSEILQLKNDAGNAILGIGQRLLEAKAILPHGEWLPWLTEQVEFSERQAQRFMKLAQEWANPTALSDLGATKALALLALPPEERQKFLSENHIVDGEEKSVIDMTSRELEKAVKERDEALHAAEAARAAAETADQSRAKMEADMTALKQLHQAAQAGETQAREALAKAQAELKALREKPVEVAVEVDQKALQEARREAETRMQAKVDKAAEAQKKAEEQRKKAEEELAAVRQQLEASRQTERQAAISGDKDLALFELLFSQGNEAVNKLHGLLLKVRGRGDIELAGKLQKALLALADVTRRCAEE
jgi:hypothetical protein|uniref:DUF3102 domain-containing protein n=1 Tax=Dysosmobacter welbionis TaxID=2093857 RepID=UPI003FEDCD15